MTDADRQLPEGGEIFLDHVGWYVPDLADVRHTFARLGFRLTPYSVHGDRDKETGQIVPQGSANHLAMLERGYLEFLTDVEGTDTPVSRHMRERMERYTGVHLTAFTVNNALAEAERLDAAGIDLQPTVNLRRDAEAADGSTVEVAYTVVRARFGLFPEGRIQTLSHHSAEHLWQARYIARENAILGLTEIVYALADPVAGAERLATFTGRRAAEVDSGMGISLDRGRLTFITPDDVTRLLGFHPVPDAPAPVAVGFSSHDLGKTRDFLARQGVRLAIDEPNRLVVEPHEALGAALIIYPERP